MNKNMFSLILLALSGTSQAGGGDIQFLGSVSTSTCDVIVRVNGTVTNQVLLGTVPVRGNGTAVKITLSPDFSQAACTLVDFDENSGQSVRVTWAGPFADITPGISPTQLKPLSGGATDAVAELLALNANDGTGIWFNPADFKVGAEFSARLKGGAERGVYRSAAAYVVSYQ